MKNTLDETVNCKLTVFKRITALEINMEEAFSG